VTHKLSSSGAAVLRWFRQGNSSWSQKGGFPIYESRGLTAMICGRLAREGYLVESFTNGEAVFTLSQAVETKWEEPGWSP
jgi:hypothetical protein